MNMNSFDLTQILPPQDLQLFQAVQKQAQELHFPLYIVGGFVRDLLLGIPSIDYDFVVVGNAILLAQNLALHHQGKITIHHEFFTAKWNPQKNNLPEHVDLISARKEIYLTPGSLPKVSLSTIQDDIHRRDFTINTLALDLFNLKKATIIDLHQGIPDLKKRIIRFLHPESFQDDPTRIFRAIRFEQRFNYHFEPQTLDALLQALPMIATLTGKRIQDEFSLFFQENHQEKCFQRAHELGVLSAIHPHLSTNPFIIQELAHINSTANINLSIQEKKQLGYALILSHNTPAQVKAISKRLMLPNKIEKIALQTSQILSNQQSYAILSPSDFSTKADIFDKITLLTISVLAENPLLKEKIAHYQATWQHILPKINGTDLKGLGIPSGPIYKTILQDIRNQKIQGFLSTLAEELEYIKKHYLI